MRHPAAVVHPLLFLWSAWTLAVVCGLAFVLFRRGAAAVAACLTLVACLSVVVAAWGFVVNDERTDVGRCQPKPDLVTVGVDLGGWAEPDECSYQTESGERAFPDGRLAGPVNTTPFRTFAVPGFVTSGVLAAAAFALTRR